MTPAQFKKEVKKLDFEQRNEMHNAFDKVYWAIHDLERMFRIKENNGVLPKLELPESFDLRSPIYHLQKEICHERYIAD